MRGYPKWFSPSFISFFLGVLFLSGLLLTPTTLEMKLEWSVPWRLGSDSKLFVAATHAFFSLAALVIVGALSSVHMRQEWKAGKNRSSGVTLLATFAFLCISGLGIYYFGNELLSVISSVSHLVVGILFLLVYVWHIFWFKKKNPSSGRKKRREKSH